MENETLLVLDEGRCARIAALDAADAPRRRLLDLGFTPGAQVRCLFSAPSGNPRAYLIRGAVIALRASDAESVRIRAEPAEA